jgi:hypothetical protein
MGHAPRNLEASSKYDPDRHIQFPRMIELKPSRFAHTAVLMSKVADRVFEGEGSEMRMPAIRTLRDRSYKMHKDEPLLQLAYDWGEADITSEIDEVLYDPSNKARIDAYEEIALDIATDPNAKEPAFDSESVYDELRMRLNIPQSFENEVSGRLLVQWGLEALPPEITTIEQLRLFLISLISFFEDMSELEIEHLSQYYQRGDWNYFDVTLEGGGVALVKDEYTDGYAFKLTERKKRPERISGQPVGCPAGFTFEDVTIAGLETVPPPEPTVIARSLTAFVNEAYDRGVLDELYNNKRRKT